MQRKYKLLDRNLIRHFGKVEVILNTDVGERFVKAGKAKDLDNVDRKKMEYTPPEHKAIFKAPEDKSIEDIKNGDTTKYPGPKDKLFSHI
jgi:hypothetical protein